MDFVDRLLHHDAWTTQRLLDVCRPLDRDQLERPFAIGPGNLHDTFVEVIAAMEHWADRIDGRPPARCTTWRGVSWTADTPTS